MCSGLDDAGWHTPTALPVWDVQDVVAATGFELVVPDEVPDTRRPTPEELHLIRDALDPTGLRRGELAG